MSSWWLIAVGALCILAAWLYTGGKHPYGYAGWGECAVFVFFGLVAVCGTEYTQAGRVTWVGVTCAVSIGCFSAAVNLANNLRDIPSDTDSGKRTLAVRLGDRGTRRLWLGPRHALRVVRAGCRTLPLHIGAGDAVRADPRGSRCSSSHPVSRHPGHAWGNRPRADSRTGTHWACHAGVVSTDCRRLSLLRRGLAF